MISGLIVLAIVIIGVVGFYNDIKEEVEANEKRKLVLRKRNGGK